MAIITSYWVRIASKGALLVTLLAGCVAVTQVIREELLSSAHQALFFAGLARQTTYQTGPGPSPTIHFPSGGPYDQRLGYTSLPTFLSRLQTAQYEVVLQARQSPRMLALAEHGIFPTYVEKTAAGLTLLDRRGASIVCIRYPERVYSRFDDIPPVVVDSLLFIENRALLDSSYSTRNPAIEWRRLARAVSARALQSVRDHERTAGGSTLATQMEKYRHSPGGRTTSMTEKLRQMVSASLRAYQHGEDTTLARRQIVVDYLNSLPLSAKAGVGEIHGFGDGLAAWYGEDFATASRTLAAISNDADGKDDGTPEEAQLYKRALSLLIAQRRPSHFLHGNAEPLEKLTNSYLRLLASAGIITEALSRSAQQASLNFTAPSTLPSPGSFADQKTRSTLRTSLATMLGMRRLYELDRLDLQVTVSLDLPIQTAVTRTLRSLADPAVARSAELYGKQLLDRGDPAAVMYSFTLYEKGDDANYLRVQTDNYGQPFDINSGAKLDLGSTAKLRTLITYLDIVAGLHHQYAGLDVRQLRALAVDPQDHLKRWAVDYLTGAQGAVPPLADMLEAALDRRYSASPKEQFFTGSGMQTFMNFRPADDGRIMSVREAFRHSVNLVFVRLLRDIVQYYIAQGPASSANLLKAVDDPRRAAYLTRFADQEGRLYLQGFYRKYRGKTAAAMEDLLMEQIRPTPPRLASGWRSIAPEATPARFKVLMRGALPGVALAEPLLDKMYVQYAPSNMSLVDRAYVAGVHPLELWLVGYLRKHPDASINQAINASAGERQAVYKWLFSAHRKHAQDKRIRSLLEVEAFLEIHRQWHRLGYPFDSLVPSYGTTVGASADRPAALAELMGIILNDGMRKPSVLIESLHFASSTPYETLLQRRATDAQRVLPAEVAHAVRTMLRDVVANGTAKRAKDAFVHADGSTIPLGGKTGTGDHRFKIYGRHAQLLESQVRNRSATFVFSIDDRYFGTLTAYVQGAAAAQYHFTSALPVQVLKALAPSLQPLFDAPASPDRVRAEAEIRAHR